MGKIIQFFLNKEKKYEKSSEMGAKKLYGTPFRYVSALPKVQKEGTS